MVPDSIAANFYTNLTDGTSCLNTQGCNQTLDPSTNLLKTTGTVTLVTDNGTPAQFFYSTSSQLGIQIPTDSTGTSVTVRVTLDGQSSPPKTITISPLAPGLFSINNKGTGQGAVQIANNAIFAVPRGVVEICRLPADRPSVTAYADSMRRYRMHIREACVRRQLFLRRAPAHGPLAIGRIAASRATAQPQAPSLLHRSQLP